MKLHLGSGKDLRAGWINVDLLDGADVKANLTKLPFDNEMASEVLLIHVLEHLSFDDERLALDEIYRVLQYGGRLSFEVPDLLWICKHIVEADDIWRDFYKVTTDPTDKQYGFGYGAGVGVVHGQLMTYLYGNQTTEYQYHRNGWTTGKVAGIARHYGYEITKLDYLYGKGSQNIWAELVKREKSR